jgi:exonuclease SbcC
MKINKIVFNNFRNYKDKHIFELNKQITILYGENGNGKSSFFDGIEWCLTGVISRFSDKKPPKGAIANKKIILGEECFVEIYFSDLCIRRAFPRNNNSFGNIDFCLLSVNNSGTYERIASGEENVDSALREIFEEKGVKYKDIKYKVGEIINKAYILSQDQVSDFVTRDKPNDRYNALASIMGFEKVLKLRKNLNNSRKMLNDAFLELENEKEELEKKRDALQTKIKPIDNEFLKRFINEYNILPQSKREVKEKSDQLQSQLFTIENEIEHINKIKHDEVDTVYDLEKMINLTQNQLFSWENKLKELVIEEDKITTEINSKNKTIVKVTQNSKVKDELTEARRNINDLSSQLDALMLEPEANSYEKIKTSINEAEKEKRIVEYARKYKNEYDSAKLFISDYVDVLSGKQAKLEKQKEHLLEISKKEDTITSKILNNDKNSSLNILIKSIEDIQNFININDQNGVCPVCLSNVGEQLDSIINENLNQLINNVGKQKEMVANELKAKDLLEIEIHRQKNIIKDLELEIENFITKNTLSQETIRNIEDNHLFGIYFFLHIEAIYQKEAYIKGKLKKLRIALDISNQIEGYKEKVALNSNVDKSILDEDLQTLLRKQDKLDKSSKLTKVNIHEAEKRISTYKKSIFQLENTKGEYEGYFKKYKEGSLVSILIILDKRQLELKKSLNLYHEVLPIIDNQQYNKEIEEELKENGGELTNVLKKSENIYNKVKIMDGILTDLDREYGEEATDFLNNSNSSIQTYYRYLNPNPSEFNNLHFEVIDNENLYIKIKHSDNNDNDGEMVNALYTDANMVLSSGQLNILALAIFIATNEAQDCSYFDFIAIDDPIQNMDDINRFSISDILGNLNRQLIFSTHDQEFLNLFLKKNELRDGDITLYTLNADENIYKSMLF